MISTGCHCARQCGLPAATPSPRWPHPRRPAACRRRRNGDAMARANKSPESRWQRVLRSLLYGHNVNREVKEKARLGLAVVAFAGIYGVIAFRLVMFAMASNGHGGARTVTQDALATARPDIIDRNGAIIATDVKTPSLFG